MLFCNEFSNCTIFTGDQCQHSTSPVLGVQGFNSRKLIGFKLAFLKPKKTHLKGKIGAEFIYNFALNCRFVLFHRRFHHGTGSPGAEPLEAYGFSCFKSPRKPVSKGKIHIISLNFQFYTPFPPEIPCFYQFKIPRVAHFPQLSSKMGLGCGPPALPHLRTLIHMHGRHSVLNCGKDSPTVSEVFAWVQEAGPLAGVVWGQRPLPKKILHLVGIRYAISSPIFVKNWFILTPNN